LTASIVIVQTERKRQRVVQRIVQHVAGGLGLRLDVADARRPPPGRAALGL